MTRWKIDIDDIKRATVVAKSISAISWLRDYKRDWFRPDIAAGITLAAYLLPSALADASLAGFSERKTIGGTKVLYRRRKSSADTVRN